MSQILMYQRGSRRKKRSELSLREFVEIIKENDPKMLGSRSLRDHLKKREERK